MILLEKLIRLVQSSIKRQKMYSGPLVGESAKPSGKQYSYNEGKELGQLLQQIKKL